MTYVIHMLSPYDYFWVHNDIEIVCIQNLNILILLYKTNQVISFLILVGIFMCFCSG